LLATPKARGEAAEAQAQKRADSIVAAIRNGASFESMVTKYSEDRLTIQKGGVLPAFGAGRMVPEFENAAFNLKKVGDVSAPVKTEFGYHIIKLLNRIPLKPFDSLHDAIKRRVENDGRNQVAQE